jgi:hypothetical protein
MQLSSALELKNEIGALLDRELVLGDDPPKIAVGITAETDEGRHRIAVRARTKADLEHQIVAFIHARAAGEVDVRVTGPIEAGPATDAAPATKRLRIGASVAHYRGTAGTLGFFARRMRDGAIGIVSNNHVLAISDGAREGDEIVHPSPADSGRRPKDVIARLSGDYPRLQQEKVVIDSAFALLSDRAAFEANVLGPGERLAEPAPLQREIEVAKIGRTTGRTSGRISAFALDNVAVDYAFGTLLFNGQLEIESHDATSFSRPGDSGSLIFSNSLHPVGLLFANCAIGGSNGSDLTYAHPIDAVLAVLGVTMMR